MSPLRLIRRVLHWHDWEPPLREGAYAVFFVVLGIIATLLLLGCQAPQRVAACVPTPRLMEAWQFAACMTGPEKLMVFRPVVDGERTEKGRVIARFDEFPLATQCKRFDLDNDGDVDLADFQEAQNGKTLAQ